MREITLREALDDYKTIYMPYRNFAERTREEYLNDLEGLIGFLEKSGINHVRRLSLPIIERYVAHLEQEGLASLTRKRKVVAIRSFLSFLFQDGYIESNLANKVVLPFTESTTPHVLTQTECNQLRLACAGNARDRAIIELLLQTGVKLSELVRLTLDDIELLQTNETGKKPNGFMRILGSRGKKERLIPLNSTAAAALINYLATRKETENRTLFLNRFGEPIGDRGIQKVLRKYLKSAELRKASIHALRHTFGTYHAVKGTPLETIQRLMGLTDPRSASIYVSLAREVAGTRVGTHTSYSRPTNGKNTAAK